MLARWLFWPGESRDDAAETTGGGRGNGAGPVCIGVVEGPLRAEIARSFLEGEGITVFLQGESVSGVYGVVSGPLAQVRVFVPAAQAEQAALLFAELDLGDE